MTGRLEPNLAYVRRYKDPHIAVKRMKDILAQSELARGRTRLAVSAMHRASPNPLRVVWFVFGILTGRSQFLK
jgi:hypothetical protein